MQISRPVSHVHGNDFLISCYLLLVITLSSCGNILMGLVSMQHLAHGLMASLQLQKKPCVPSGTCLKSRWVSLSFNLSYQDHLTQDHPFFPSKVDTATNYILHPNLCLHTSIPVQKACASLQLGKCSMCICWRCYNFRQLRQLSTVIVSKVRSQMSLKECKSWTCIVLLGLRVKVQVKGLSIKD